MDILEGGKANIKAIKQEVENYENGDDDGAAEDAKKLGKY